MRYIPLRVHSVFSRGLGAVSAYENASYSLSQGLPAMALCDLHSIVGWESFFQQALKQGLKPMLGLEIKLQEMGTLLIFPRNDCGFSSLTHSLNHRVFSRYSDLLVVFISTGWSLSRVAAVLDRLKGIVKPENLYIGLEWGTKREVVLQAQHYAIPLVWAQPLKYFKNPEKFVVARSVFNHHSITENLNCMSRGEIPLFGPITAGAIFKRWHKLGKEAMKNTFDLAAKVCFKFDAGSCAPDYTSFSSRQRLTEMVKRKMVLQGCCREEKRRSFIELKVINELGFAPFFLVAARLAGYCHREKIYFNSRGSAASSFILFLLGLSQVNPLNHQLIFERFINRYRDDLPDIDIDIDSSRRPQVLEWLFGVFPGKVSFVSSHKFFGARSALYGVARCFGFDVEDAHRMSREMPMFASPDELLGQGRGKFKELYRYASLLQGVFKELSLHIGGVVFSGEENRQTFPLEKSPAGFDQVVWDKDTIRRLKIFKLDLLGVRGFEVIAPVAAPGTVDFEDTEAWKNIRTARTIGCFQLESPLARDSLLKVKPQTLRQLAITIAVIRPGPARCGMRSSYLNPPNTNHPILKRLFPHSRGAIIFEEQITLLLQAVSGWCLERAEKVRKDIKSGAGRTYKQQFMERGIERGWPQNELEKFWRLAERFSLYAFNQAHSIVFSHSAYISAWFKTRFPVEFFCRLLNSGAGYYPLPLYVAEAKEWGVILLPPDINFSDVGFIVENGAVRTGLIFVKWIGAKISSRIVACRGSGYSSLEEFINRIKPTDQELSALMAVSAFSSLGCPGFTGSRRENNFNHYLGFLPSL